MKQIVDIVSKYICAGRRIVIPELGAFLVKQPTGEVVFSEFLKQDDRVLRGELIEEGMKPLEAAGAINRFVFEARHALRSVGEFDLEGIGTLSLNSVTSKIIFIPEGAEPSTPTAPKLSRDHFTPVSKRSNIKAAQEAEQSAVEGDVTTDVEQGAVEGGEATNSEDSSGDKSDIIVVNREFSGRFCDDDLPKEPLRYSHEYRRYPYKRGDSFRTKRVDFVMVIVVAVIILAVGAIGYGVYISSQVGESNPILDAWESVVSFFGDLF